jgi:RES domain-containing protein
MLEGTPLSAIGSRVRGGRYNRKGAFEAFYLANTQETALYETEAIFKMALQDFEWVG